MTPTPHALFLESKKTEQKPSTNHAHDVNKTQVQKSLKKYVQTEQHFD